jgi:hypothetical protein
MILQKGKPVFPMRNKTYPQRSSPGALHFRSQNITAIKAVKYRGSAKPSIPSHSNIEWQSSAPKGSSR